MYVTGGRLAHLKLICAGYKKLGIPLVGYNETSFISSSMFDDIGIYIFIPKLVTALGISLKAGIYLFFNSIIGISFLFGLLGLWLLYPSWLQRLISFTGLLLLTLFTIKVGSTYIVHAMAVILLIPLGIYCYQTTMNNRYYLFIFFSGLAGSFFHYIRAYSSIAPLLFIFFLMLFNTELNAMKKIKLCSFFLIGFSIPIFFVQYEVKQYQDFAQKHFPTYTLQALKHPLWHTIYCGFGFLMFGNNDKIEFNDRCVDIKVNSLRPNTLQTDPSFEKIIKNEVLSILKTQKGFVLRTLFAKLGILFMYLLIFANVGLLASLYYRKSYVIEGAFLIAFCFNAIFPIIAIPIHAYSLGFIAIATLYGIVSINQTLDTGFLQRMIGKYMLYKIPSK